VARKFFLPQMKRIVDHIKSKGKIAYLHSCGHVESRIDIFVEAGFQWWDPMRMNDTRELYHRVGDKILLSVHPDKVPEGASEEEQREAARRYVEEFCVPGKPSVLFWYGLEGMSAVYNEELYRQSRIAYSK
ncbi:MAG: methyltransferase, partial [Firmicutes bacterium]|nr:methyltransferase [Bacillota bacterium]